jgi:hypothetical protein
MKKAAKAPSKDDRKSLVDRLRQTDIDHYSTESREYQLGVVAGEAWVREVATSRHLRRLERIWEKNMRQDVVENTTLETNTLFLEITGDEEDDNYAQTSVSAKQRFVTCEGCPDRDSWPHQYTLGFFDGAVALWKEVKADIPDPSESQKSTGLSKKKRSK